MSSSPTATSHTEFLVSRGAVLNEAGDLADHFGDPRREFAAFSDSAALLDRTAATCLVQKGTDALDLLHRLSTNELISLEQGNARFTLLTSERGRIIDALQVARLDENRLLLLSESTDARPAVEWIEKFTIIEDSEVSDASSGLGRLALIGPNALKIAQAAFSVELARDCVVTRPEAESETVLVASRWGNVDRVDIVFSRSNLGVTWERLVAADAIPAGEKAFEATRISAGVPVTGRELTDEANPLEVNLKGLVSFTKGCYVGQEVVARLDTYDKLQRRLVAFESESPVTEGTKLVSDGKRAGVVTSVSPLADASKFAAMGFARRGFWDEGTVLEFDGGTVTVRKLSEDSAFC